MHCTANSISPIRSSENMLRILGHKIASGRDLTMAERLIAMTAASQVTAGIYGPGPAEMEVRPMDLPESVKGMLLHYAG